MALYLERKVRQRDEPALTRMHSCQGGNQGSTQTLDFMFRTTQRFWVPDQSLFAKIVLANRQRMNLRG